MSTFYLVFQMSRIWNYFALSGRIAFCKDENCKYSKAYPPRAPTTTLKSHLKTQHPELYAQLKKDEAIKESEQPLLKRAFASSSQICDEEPLIIGFQGDDHPSIIHSLGLKGILNILKNFNKSKLM